jgi:hypothetical protein
VKLKRLVGSMPNPARRHYVSSLHVGSVCVCVCIERRSSPKEGLRTLDAPGGTAAGGLSDMVACAAARMLAYDRQIRLNERLDIANECTHD